MGKSKFQNLKVHEEATIEPDVRVFKVDGKKHFELKSFESPAFKDLAHQGKMKQLAMERRSFTGQKTEGFVMSSLVQGPASRKAQIQQELEESLAVELEKYKKNAEEQGYEAGYQKGLEVGKKEVFQQLSDEAKERIEQLNEIVTEFESLRLNMFKANEHLLIKIVYSVAKKVLLRELSEDKEYIGRLIERLCERVSGSEFVTIEMSKEEHDNLQTLSGNWEEKIDQLNNVKIEKSDSIKNRGCRVSTDWGEIDAKVDLQLMGIEESLFDAD